MYTTEHKLSFGSRLCFRLQERSA